MTKVKAKDRLNTKAGKLWLEVQKGKTPREAAKAIGISPNNSVQMLETQVYQALEKSSYNEELIRHITMAQIAEEHIKVMTQDKDLGAKNTAIKMAIDKLEPQGVPLDDQEKILVILR